MASSQIDYFLRLIGSPRRGNCADAPVLCASSRTACPHRMHERALVKGDAKADGAISRREGVSAALQDRRWRVRSCVPALRKAGPDRSARGSMRLLRPFTDIQMNG